jgi:deoxyhypusine synthase
VDPDRLPDAVVCYTDATIALPLLTAYALARHEPRKPKRLFRRRGELMEQLGQEFRAALAGREASEKVSRPGTLQHPMIDRDR